MKRAILSSGLLLLSICCLAQKNWVSVTINNYYKWNISETIDDTLAHYSGKGLQMLPSVGYYRILKDNWGVGLELGFQNLEIESDGDGHISRSEIAQIRSTSSLKEYYFCPVIFEMFQWKNYRFTGSVTLPVNYITDIAYDDHFEYGFKAVDTAYFVFDYKGTSPNELRIGLLANGGIQRKIYRNFYFGPQIGLGFIYSRVNGTLTQDIRRFDNNIVTEQHSETKLNNTRSLFDFRMSFSVNYYF